MAASESQLRRVVVNAAMAEVLAFGIYTAAFLYTLLATVRKRKDVSSRPDIIVVLLLLYACATIHCSLTWWYTVKEFAAFGGSEDFLSHFLHDQPLFYTVLGFLSFIFSTVIADSISIWRCWILLGSRIWVIVLPVMGVVSGFVLAIMSLSAQIQIVKNPNEPITFSNARFASFSTPYLLLSLGSTLYTTILIVIRLAMVTQSYSGDKQLQMSSRSITRGAGMIIESALIYSTVHAVAVAFLEANSPFFEYAQNLLPQFAGLAPTLVLLRVLSGYTQPTGWSRERGHMSSLRFSTAPDTEASYTAAGNSEGGTESKDH